MSETSFIDIPIDLVKPGLNFRKRFDEAGMAELTESVRKVGVLQPVLVTLAPDNGGHYILVSGERRYRAAVAAGLDTIPAVMRNLDERERKEIALIENLHRRDLTAIEEARGYKALIEECGLKQEEVAERVGVSQPQVSNRLRLLRLPEKAQALIEDGTLAAGHGLALLKYVPDGNVYEPFFSELIEDYAKRPGPVNEAEYDLGLSAARVGRRMRGLSGAHYYPGCEFHYALFDITGCNDCPAIVSRKDQYGESRCCMDFSCYDAKQKIALGEMEAAGRDKCQVRQSPEPRETPEERRQREEEAKERERKREEKIQKRIEKVAKKAAPAIPQADTTEARRLRSLVKWEGGPYTVARECYLELAQLIGHFRERQDLGATSMPVQFGHGTLTIPDQGITVEGSFYGSMDASQKPNITLEPLTVRWASATIADSKPTGPVYYRCGLRDMDATKYLHQALVIPCGTRDIVIDSDASVTMRRDLVPKLAALVMALPAFPGAPEDEGTTEAQAEMSEAPIAEDAEDGVTAGPQRPQTCPADGEEARCDACIQWDEVEGCMYIDPDAAQATEDEPALEPEAPVYFDGRLCPDDGHLVSKEYCAEHCLQWHSAQGCTHRVGAVPVPDEAQPAEAPKTVVPTTGGVRVCPKTREVVIDEECAAGPCEEWNIDEGGCLLWVESKKPEKGEVA